MDLSHDITIHQAEGLELKLMVYGCGRGVSGITPASSGV